MERKIGQQLAKPNETIQEHTDNLKKQAKILKELHYLENEQLYQDLLTACEYHDYGKANSAFQRRIKKHTRFDTHKEIPHNVLSLFFIDEDECIDYTAVCFAVLYHHYHHNNSPIRIFKDEESLIKKFLKEMLGTDELYEDMEDCIDDIEDLFKETDENKKYAVLLKGFLHKCDYSASAGLNCEEPNDFLMDSLKRWQEGLNGSLRPLQEFCLKNTDKNLIVTAPTGMGKTEAGLLWSGDHKCFFVLPLKTAINAMYERIKTLSGSAYQKRVALLHSDMYSYYLRNADKDEENESRFDFDYCDRSRQMSLPITVCTPDQIFNFVFKAAGYEYKLATASYSRFIIDEIQMYSPDILAAIMQAIRMIHAIGGKIAVLTATLPPIVRQELENIFGDDAEMADFSADGILRHNVSVFEKNLEAEDIYQAVEEIKSDTVRKFLVVCNSIDTANKLYDELKTYYNDSIPVHLFHARFTKDDRAKKEKQILDAVKNTTTEIWISTSVVEASLDIDFDILFTELSDLFSLFQRFGRVNRRGKKDISVPNCYVYTELQGNAKKYKFTDETIYAYSKQATLTMNGIISEQEKKNLIDEYLSVENLKDSKYMADYLDIMKYFRELPEYVSDPSEKLRNIDTIDVIPESVYNGNRETIDRALSVISDSMADKEKIFEQHDKIVKFTVSVSRFHSRKTISYIKSGHLSIPILGSCEYTEDKGLVMLQEELSKETYSAFL
ncbi:MAG: CRISPR-associated helicase Cas3' [Acutalibacteraceae bacterium]